MYDSVSYTHLDVYKRQVRTIDCSGLPVGNHGNVTVTLKEIDGVTYTMSGTVSVNVTNAENK